MAAEAAGSYCRPCTRDLFRTRTDHPRGLFAPLRRAGRYLTHDRRAPLERESLGERSENRSVRRHGAVNSMLKRGAQLRNDLWRATRKLTKEPPNFRIADHPGVGPTVVSVSAVCQSRQGRWHSCPLRVVKRI